MTSNWLELDRKGLAQVIESRPKSFVLFELIQNALDENVTEINVQIEASSQRGKVWITVTDNSPDGYQDIKHAWTLFAPSKKKGNPELRGRFNIGCKHVLALAECASIISTESSVSFDPKGRQLSRRRREAGTEFKGLFRLTKQEAYDACGEAMRLLPPDGVKVTVTDLDGLGLVVRRSAPFETFELQLPTIIADDEGYLRNTRRKCSVEVHKPKAGETPTLYEMGVPVVALDGDDPWHINVLQRVPLNTDRDNVTPAYLRTLRVAVLNAGAERLTSEQAMAVWATEASEDERADDAAVVKILDHRFGKKRVAYDPSDPEANKLATAEGYTVVPGGSLTKGQWRNARESGTTLPAGKVTPSPRIKSAADGVPPVPPKEWTSEMREIQTFAQELCQQLRIKPKPLSVMWYDHWQLPWRGGWGRSLLLNKALLGEALRHWREGRRHEILELLVHEFAHEQASDHLSSDYYAELCRLGALLYHLDA